MENKSIYFLIIGLVLIIITVALVYFLVFENPKNITPSLISLTQMSGKVTEVKDGSIVVRGFIGSDNKDIEFDITNAELVKNSIVLTSNQVMNSGTFHPETQQVPGNIPDLIIGKTVTIASKENLLSPDILKATAIKINYTAYGLSN